MIRRLRRWLKREPDLGVISRLEPTGKDGHYQLWFRYRDGSERCVIIVTCSPRCAYFHTD